MNEISEREISAHLEVICGAGTQQRHESSTRDARRSGERDCTHEVDSYARQINVPDVIVPVRVHLLGQRGVAAAEVDYAVSLLQVLFDVWADVLPSLQPIKHLTVCCVVALLPIVFVAVLGHFDLNT